MVLDVAMGTPVPRVRWHCMRCHAEGNILVEYDDVVTNALLVLMAHTEAVPTCHAEQGDFVVQPIDRPPIQPVGECVCRNPGCGHRASLHTGREGACIVPGCKCGPQGWA